MASLFSVTPYPRTAASGRKWPRREALDPVFPGRIGPRGQPGGPGSRFPVRSLSRAFQGIRILERADADHRAAHAAGCSAGDDYVSDPFSPHHGGAALPPASLEHPGNTLQSGSDWSGTVPDAGNYATGGDGHVPERLGAVRGRTGHLAGGLERWFRTIENLFA